MWYRRWWSTNFQRLIPKKDVEFEKATGTCSSNHDGDPRLARGTDQGPSSVCEGLWRAWLNLIIVVSLAHSYAQTHTRARAWRDVCARADESRVGSAKSQQLTHYSRWTQHSHLVRDVRVVIFNTSGSVSSRQRLFVREIEIAWRLHVGGWRGRVPLVGTLNS